MNLLPDYNKVSFPEMAPLDCALCLPTIPLVARDFVFSLVSLNPEKRLTAAMVRLQLTGSVFCLEKHTF